MLWIVNVKVGAAILIRSGSNLCKVTFERDLKGVREVIHVGMEKECNKQRRK